MANPCEQADNISHIHDALKRMETASRDERFERRESEKKLMEILGKVVDQGARMTNVESHLEVHFSNIQEIFGRLHDVEMIQASNGPTIRIQLGESINQLESSLQLMTNRLGKINNFIRIVSHKYAVGAYIALAVMTVAGALCDFLYHYETMKRFLGLF